MLILMDVNLNLNPKTPKPQNPMMKIEKMKS